MSSLLVVVFLLLPVDSYCRSRALGEPWNEGGLTTGRYRNVFAEMGYDEVEVERRLQTVFDEVFRGPDKVYFEVGDDMGYVSDIKNHDVRTEGMSYGMMIAVQRGERDIFDRLWRWAKRYMQQADGPLKGYFAWSCNTDGTHRAEGPASDGELYYVTALLFAHNLWGSTGTIDYLGEARHILDCSWEKDGTDGVWPLIDKDTHLITFVPNGLGARFTDPSYHLPAFYEVWALYADDGRADFYRQCADAARRYLHAAINLVTGLNADNTLYDGTPYQSPWGLPPAFRYDSWRVPMNIALDYSWSCADGEWQRSYANTIQQFFYGKGIDCFVDQYAVDGSDVGTILSAGNAELEVTALRHSVGLVATLGAVSLVADNRHARDFAKCLWESENRPYADGYFDAYYDGLLRLFAFMHLSGHYRVITPADRIVNRPLVQTRYTADPAPMVHGDTVYLFTTHDEDYANGFEMYDWLLYTSTDMVNWTDHGPVASTRDFSWRSRDNGAWALQVAERDGKWFMYCPLHGHGIGVLVADNPDGPYTDPLGHPLVWQREHWDDIDPTVYIDDDGQAYMYWGNPTLYMVRLNDDMISYSGEIQMFPHIEDYQEGPWIWRRDDRYYLAFASTCCPEGIGYAMSNHAEGPWEYQGPIMDHTPRTRGNHPGIIEYKGKWYVFGLNYDVMHEETFEHHERRSVSAAEMRYRADGTIQEVPYWQDATLTQVGPFNPYRKVEAETMAWGYGLKTERDSVRGMVVTDFNAGEHLMLRGVDFGKGAKKFSATVNAESEGIVEIHVDAADGPVIGRLEVKTTDGRWNSQSCRIRGAKSIHDLYYVFRTDCNMQWDSWRFR